MSAQLDSTDEKDLDSTIITKKEDHHDINRVDIVSYRINHGCFRYPLSTFMLSFGEGDIEH